MIKRIKDCFSSYEKFVMLQFGLRRRILEYYYWLFPRLIVRRMNNYSKSYTTSEEFIIRVSSILKIPNIITADEEEKKLILREADKTVNGVYNVLGSGDVDLITTDWHTDFKTGYRWSPGTFFRKYNQEDLSTDSDVKVPRELSRCHHLLKLGLAYKLTNDEKYAKVCIEQMHNWIDENPLMFSINWGCAMDVAIRAVNWLWVIGFLQNSVSLDDKTLEKIKCSLYQHGWFIWRNLEKEPVYSGNHYMADLAGLIHLGLLFTGLKEPNKWLLRGKQELFREIRIEILPSGMSYERSTNYNRLVLELVLVPILLLKHSKHEIPNDIWFRIEKMFEFVLFSIEPDGLTPIIGDQDNGRLLPFNISEITNFRYLLSLGALLFKSTFFKQYGEGLNIYCLILGGQDASEKWNDISANLIEMESKAFPDIGLFIMREKDNYLIFNATGRGICPEVIPGSHTHSDLLSFELFTHGKPFLIDPGSFVYTADADQRMLFRSTHMHNTVTVDGKSQDELRREDIWDFDRNAIPEILSWESDAYHDIITARHNGYSRLSEPVVHQRTLIFDKPNEKWIIHDHLIGEAQHKLEWFLHFNPGIDFIINDHMVETICQDGKNIKIIFDQSARLCLNKMDSYVSKSYGTREHGFVLVAAVTAALPFELSIEISKSDIK